jgi:hypothetical protein
LRGKQRRIYLFIHEYDVFMRKNALKTAEKSGKKAKISCFSHINQNSIAEIVSTMESFLVAERGVRLPTLQERTQPTLRCPKKLRDAIASYPRFFDRGGTRGAT